MRKRFIDNIRWILILLLFPLHTLFVYNGLGVDFYVLQTSSLPITVILSFFSMWAMPLLLLLAGVSSRYSLRKRTLGQYALERFTKLLLPLVAGTVLLLPVLCYFGEKFQNGFTGSLLDEYVLFFTGTGNTVFDGGWTIYRFSYLWFIAYLFAMSIVALPLIALIQKKSLHASLDKVPAWAVVLFGGAAYVGMDIFLPNVPDKNFIDMTFAFLLGFCFFSRDDMQEWLGRMRWFFLIALAAVFIFGWSVLWTVPFVWTTGSWLGMMAAMGFGVRLLSKTGRVSKYFSAASYGIYFFHMPWVVILSYYLILAGASPLVHIAVTIPASFAGTMATYEVVRRIPGLRFIFALRRP